MSFGDNLRVLREKQRLSQREVADAVNVVQSTYCDWENGNCYPRANHLPMLASALNVGVEVILKSLIIE